MPEDISTPAIKYDYVFLILKNGHAIKGKIRSSDLPVSDHKLFILIDAEFLVPEHLGYFSILKINSNEISAYTIDEGDK